MIADQRYAGSSLVPMRYFDLAVILGYLAGITWFGAHFRKGQHSLRDYFLGGRNAPWWAIGLSIVSAETSTLTIIGTPALAFGGNLGFLQLVLGYLAARIAICLRFSAALFPRRDVHGVRVDAAPFRRAHPQARGRRVPGDARAGRRRAGVRRLAGDFHRARRGRDPLHRPDRDPHAVLHLRRRHDRGDLDRRGADDAVRGGRHPQPAPLSWAAFPAGGNTFWRWRAPLTSSRFSTSGFPPTWPSFRAPTLSGRASRADAS